MPGTSAMMRCTRWSIRSAGRCDAGPVKGALAVFDAGGFEVRNDGEILPYFAFEAVLCELLAENGVGFADSFEAVAGDGAGAADAQAGAGEGLAVDHALGQAKGFADFADFVLEEGEDGLYQFKAGGNVLGKAADVVVSLDAGFALKDVGPDSTLCQEGDVIKFSCFFREDVDELLADDVAFLLRISDAGQLVEEAVCGIDIDEVCFHLILENLDDLLGFTFAEQSVVYVDAGKLIADCLDQEGSDDGGINTAGKSQKNLLISHLLCDLFDLFVDKCLRQGRCRDSFHILRASSCLHSFWSPFRA